MKEDVDQSTASYARLVTIAAVAATAVAGLMGVSLLLTLGLVLFQSYVIRKTDSVAIRADQLRSRSDIIIHMDPISVTPQQFAAQHMSEPQFIKDKV
ncbi:hypothetical protein GCM10011502_13490 [Oceanisphaera marina]|uniref:Uncharacterized protein n=1 Tax=Oceanisphaera marina TaxID=2017550 RepID=A0ABQ1IIM4_9GAMM|nr:hypothetical protein [Oceanisphaera marina]GGB41478.1 hypothetical protein GCM10011502_13490 [Oceanisphaera marina]